MNKVTKRSKSVSQSITSVSSLEEESTISDEVPQKFRWGSSKKGKPKLPNNLTDHEKSEQKAFRKIYFSGLPAKKKPTPDISRKDDRCFDDGNGYCKAIVGDHVAYRYEILEISGRGNFSEVLRTKDHRAKRKKANPKVAIKIMRDQTPEHLRLIYRESGILNFIRRADREDKWNILRLYRNFSFRGHVCFVTEELFMDLYSYLKQKDFMPLDQSFVQTVAVYVLRALEFLSTLGIVHADLKPENVMLCGPKSAKVKLVDFTWSWVLDRDQVLSSDYFQSRFHRAPEVILGGPLSHALDMWSYGCLIAELAAGVPLFAGDDRHDQLAVIIEILGFPPVDVLSWSRSPLYFTEDFTPYYCYELEETMADGGKFVILAGSVLDSGEIRGVPGSKHVNSAMFGDKEVGYGKDFFDFLFRCFEWLPDRRWTPAEASCHCWISGEYRMIDRGEKRSGTLVSRLKQKSTALKSLFARKRYRKRQQRASLHFGSPKSNIPTLPSSSSISDPLLRQSRCEQKADETLQQMYERYLEERPAVARSATKASARSSVAGSPNANRGYPDAVVSSPKSKPEAFSSSKEASDAFIDRSCGGQGSGPASKERSPASSPHGSPAPSVKTAASDRGSEMSTSEIVADMGSPLAKASID